MGNYIPVFYIDVITYAGNRNVHVSFYRNYYICYEVMFTDKQIPLKISPPLLSLACLLQANIQQYNLIRY